MIGPALMVSAQQKPDEGSIPVSISIVRLKRNRLVVARQRLVEPLEGLKGGTTAAERLGVVRLERNCFVVARQGLVKSLEFLKSKTAVAERFGGVRLERNRLVVAR